MEKNNPEELATISDEDLKHKELQLRSMINERCKQGRNSSLTNLEIDLCYVQRELSSRRLKA